MSLDWCDHGAHRDWIVSHAPVSVQYPPPNCLPGLPPARGKAQEQFSTLALTRFRASKARNGEIAAVKANATTSLDLTEVPDDI